MTSRSVSRSIPTGTDHSVLLAVDQEFGERRDSG
jgi:hypothetical protein